ncbi:actin-binding Rho-activating protein [Elysia marginata]|uniref:Actin-binding Rho-activating protein n=1 Tax=Elysia marginata TaxID=1093978 RepID=A0AAV4J966_9GAST|nr:actin-binding Rho-activating protein [Elysia marginata]
MTSKLSYRERSQVECKSLRDRWQSFAENHQAGQAINPWNDWGHRKALDKNDPEYGRPVKGSLTELRGKKAEKHVNNEIRELCHWINHIGTTNEDGTASVTFGKLFDAYTRISDTLVGWLVRARKRGYVTFEGEMLYQGKDNNVIITRIQMPPEED